MAFELWEIQDVIMALADPGSHGGKAEDAFDIVVPSLPGFYFSSPLDRADIGYIETTNLWVKLMKFLGYRKFGMHGGDAGAVESAQLGHTHADFILVFHSSFPVFPRFSHEAGDPAKLTPEERDLIG